MQVHIGSLLVCLPGTSPVFQTEWDIWDITAAPRLATLCLSMVCMSPFTHSHTFLNISQFRKMTSNSPLVSPPPPPRPSNANYSRVFLLSPGLAWSPYKVSNFANKWFLDGCKNNFVFNSAGPIADWSRSKQRIEAKCN